MRTYSVVIVDDHSLFAQSLQGLINSFDDFQVLYHVKNGKELVQKLESNSNAPDVILLDINMPVMNGIETMEWLKEHRPDQKVIVLSMDDDEETIIRMLRNGARGYLLKDIDPDVFKDALNDSIHKGFYYTDRISKTLLGSLHKEEKGGVKLKERELEFLKLACTEKTYKEIAGDMFLSPKTIDGYREALFEKLQVRSRIGLVLYAIKNEIFKP
ncbi:response regulator [Sungkyunkwania multivorans]|uniref:Response regulator n=1 Tax=Sungkyunkwania multivorans TaxID=1173618 RepID=A0ABW3CW17_9FLAO